MLLKVWLSCEFCKQTLWAAIKDSLVSIVWLGVACGAALATIKFVFATTEFVYAGWSGFGWENIVRVVLQYLNVSNAWLFAVLCAVFLFVRLRSKWFPCSREKLEGTTDPSPDEERVSDLSIGVIPSLIAAGAVWLLITLPQLLLYMKTGILSVTSPPADYSRYIVPCMLGYALLVTQILRLIRRSDTGMKWFRSFAVVLVCITLTNKTVTAWRDGAAFARYSRVNDSWFETIVENTKPMSPIVLVYYNYHNGARATLEAQRAYFILRQRHGRANIFFSPFPPEPTIEEGARASIKADTKRHAKTMRSVDQLKDPASVDAVLILNLPGMTRYFGKPISLVLDDFLQDRENWLNAPRPRLDWVPGNEFRREDHPHWHVSYFRVR